MSPVLHHVNSTARPLGGTAPQCEKGTRWYPFPRFCGFPVGLAEQSERTLGQMRTRVKRLLTESGMRVVGEARDGNEAAELYAALRPDFVTMDMTMLGMIEEQNRIHL